MSERNPIFLCWRDPTGIFFQGERSLSSLREPLSGIQAGEIPRFLRSDPAEDPFTFIACFYKKKFCVIQVNIFVFYVYNI
jgi:hypothetical protein